jgi:hypothetical protein
MTDRDTFLNDVYQVLVEAFDDGGNARDDQFIRILQIPTEQASFIYQRAEEKPYLEQQANEVTRNLFERAKMSFGDIVTLYMLGLTVGLANLGETPQEHREQADALVIAAANLMQAAEQLREHAETGEWGDNNIYGFAN